MHYGHRPDQWCEGAALADEKPQDAPPHDETRRTPLHPPTRCVGRSERDQEFGQGREGGWTFQAKTPHLIFGIGR
jgi:hypothetical protein